MIFVTVGAQMAFDRLINTVDYWAGQTGRRDVFAQVGPSTCKPQHIQWTHFLDPVAFRRHIESASVVVAHAGMGSILTALELGKPIVVMPRRGDLRETRNDHQVATARRFLAQGRVIVAFDEGHLVEKLNAIQQMTGSQPIANEASPQLLEALRQFVNGRKLGMPQVAADMRIPHPVAASRQANVYEASTAL